MMRSVIVVVITAAMLHGRITFSVRMIVERRNGVPRNDSLDAISIRIGLDNEPKQDVDHVHNPDSLQMQRR